MIHAVKTGLGAVESGFRAAGKAGEALENLMSAASHMTKYLEVSAETFAKQAEQERDIKALEFQQKLAEKRAKLALPQPTLNGVPALPNG